MNGLFNFIITHYQLCIVMVGTSVLGITTGALGPFAILRKQSLLADALSHATLPGIALAFLLTGSKDPCIHSTGGILTAVLGTIMALLLKRTTHLKFDTILGLILSVFFGAGLVVISELQKRPIAQQAMLSKLMFGNASALLHYDVLVMTVLGLIILTCLISYWKEFKLIAFDAAFARSLGYPVFALDVFLTLLLILTIVSGLQTVGAILMSTLLIAPACAARQWTTSLDTMVILSCAISFLCALGGSVISNIYDIPTGPAIVVLLSLVVGISLSMRQQHA